MKNKDKDPVLAVAVTGYLTSARVEHIFKDCLFREEEIAAGIPEIDPLIVEGLVRKYGFHPSRVTKHQKEIELLLAELPDKFLAGSSFLGLCYDKVGSQWTGEQRKMEQLVCLGLAIDAIAYCMPKSDWSTLPGGLPYIQIKLDTDTPKSKVELKTKSQKNSLPDLLKEKQVVNSRKKVLPELTFSTNTKKVLPKKVATKLGKVKKIVPTKVTKVDKNKGKSKSKAKKR